MQVLCSTDNKQKKQWKFTAGKHYHQKIFTELTIFDISHVPSGNICVRIRPFNVTKYHLIDFCEIFQTLETEVQVKWLKFV